MNKIIYISSVIILLLAGLLLTRVFNKYYLQQNNHDCSDGTARCLKPEDNENSPIDNSVLSSEIKVTGKFICLPHKGNPEVVTMECAFGFQSNNGENYGVKVKDEMMNLDMENEHTIRGIFTEGESTDIYDTVGYIEIQEIIQN